MRKSWTPAVLLSAALFADAPVSGADEPPTKLEPGVRGLVTRASGKVTLDGKLDDWTGAYCTPIQYGHKDPMNRAAQFYYLWDDEAFYVGLRCLDAKQANLSQPRATFDGDAVEFYLDTRGGNALKGKEWSDGAIHFYYSPFEGTAIKPRWVMRQGIATSGVELKGVEVMGSRTATSYEVEFKLPWSNFPGFAPKAGAVMALDAELCYSDGAGRTDRSFAYGSPLSVQQPASLGKVELVKAFDPDYLAAVGPSSFPLWVETPWVQPERGAVQATVAVPPAFAEVVGEIEVRIHDADGKVVKTLPARTERFGPEDLNFVRALAFWPVDEYAPGAYFATAKVSARTGKALATVAPRMVSEAIITGR